MGCCFLVELVGGGALGPVELLGGRHALLDGGGGYQAGLSGYKAFQEDVLCSAHVSVAKLGYNG